MLIQEDSAPHHNILDQPTESCVGPAESVGWAGLVLMSWFQPSPTAMSFGSGEAWCSLPWESYHSCPEFPAKNEMRERDKKKKKSWADSTVWGFTEYSNTDFFLRVCGEPVTWMLPSHYCDRSILSNNNGTRNREQKVRGKTGPERDHVWIQA